LTKRRLTQQQSTRIRGNQRASADRASQTPGADDTQREGEFGPEQPGLIVAHFGRQAEVEAPDGTVTRCHLRANLDVLVTGDQVVWRANPAGGSGVVVASLPRRSLLARPDSHLQQPRPVAANVDRIIVVIAPEPEPFANLIDRYLVAAEALDIPPLLLLNKSDLLREQNSARIEALLDQYRSIGYPVLTCSTAANEGTEALEATLRDHVSIVVGQSGVGKSSLIRALLPGIEIRIGELSQGEHKGRHTTTTARLFHLPHGGDLIDSPGIREFGLGHLERARIETGFIEFRPWLGRCRFRDCRHEVEPKCALLEALAAGRISPERMASYRSILRSVEED
jgi:ribosome biogenesis GTPase